MKNQEEANRALAADFALLIPDRLGLDASKPEVSDQIKRLAEELVGRIMPEGLPDPQRRALKNLGDSLCDWAEQLEVRDIESQVAKGLWDFARGIGHILRGEEDDMWRPWG